MTFFHTPSTFFIQVCAEMSKELYSEAGIFMKICAVQTHFTTGRKRITIPGFQIYYPIWVEFGTRALHIILLSICNFCGNWRKEGRTFIMGVYKITFMPYTMKPYDMLKAKEIKHLVTF
jgi:hypothetical protein